MKKARLLSGALLLSLAAAGATVAQQVQNPVVADGYMLRFSVRSNYGPFEVTGTPALRKLATEIGAIAKLREIKTSKTFTSAVVDSATGPFKFAKNLIVHPVDTTTGALPDTLSSKAMPGYTLGMHVVTITAKRQATLPAALCKELGLAPGAKVAVERRLVGKETVWVLKGPGPDWSWVGSLRRYAKGKSHRLSDIRRNIARGWAGGHRA